MLNSRTELPFYFDNWIFVTFVIAELVPEGYAGMCQCECSGINNKRKTSIGTADSNREVGILSGLGPFPLYPPIKRTTTTRRPPITIGWKTKKPIVTFTTTHRPKTTRCKTTMGWKTKTTTDSGWGWGPETVKTKKPTTTRRSTTKRTPRTKRTTTHGWGWGGPPVQETIKPIIADPPAKDCCELIGRGFKESGVYSIRPNDYEISVYCDMEDDGGGWTVLIRREPIGGPTTKFYVSKKIYEEGFGNPATTYWLGLKNWVTLLEAKDQQLKVSLETFKGEKYDGVYGKFNIDAKNDYFLTFAGFVGNMKNSMANNTSFNTPDSDRTEIGCAQLFEAGWWYDGHDCYGALLTGKYKEEYESEKVWYDDDESDHGITWNSVTSKMVDGVRTQVSLKSAAMKVRSRSGCANTGYAPNTNTVNVVETVNPLPKDSIDEYTGV